MKQNKIIMLAVFSIAALAFTVSNIYSLTERGRHATEGAVGGLVVGATVGGLAGGPVGAAVGAGVGVTAGATVGSTVGDRDESRVRRLKKRMARLEHRISRTNDADKKAQLRQELHNTQAEYNGLTGQGRPVEGPARSTHARTHSMSYNVDGAAATIIDNENNENDETAVSGGAAKSCSSCHIKQPCPVKKCAAKHNTCGHQCKKTHTEVENEEAV